MLPGGCDSNGLIARRSDEVLRAAAAAGSGAALIALGIQNDEATCRGCDKGEVGRPQNLTHTFAPQIEGPTCGLESCGPVFAGCAGGVASLHREQSREQDPSMKHGRS